MDNIIPPRTAEEKARDLTMLQHPERWPRWPVLPLKRYHGKPDDPELGLIIAGGASPIRVYLGCIFLFSGPTHTSKYMEYPSLAAVIGDGWWVD